METNIVSASTSDPQELNFDEIKQVNGGIAPIILLYAVGATYIQFNFVAGVVHIISWGGNRAFDLGRWMSAH